MHETEASTLQPYTHFAWPLPFFSSQYQRVYERPDLLDVPEFCLYTNLRMANLDLIRSIFIAILQCICLAFILVSEYIWIASENLPKGTYDEAITIICRHFILQQVTIESGQF